MQNYIVVKGARQHNLKNISLRIPRDQLVVFTGVSGSGKSSLVFNTLYAEGRRRLMESLSAYERMGLRKTEEADVDLIEGLSPAIAMEQKTVSRNPRSTVGTLTEISSFVRLLFSRTSRTVCPYCQEALSVQTRKKITEQVLRCSPDTSIEIYAPILSMPHEGPVALLKEIQKKGYTQLSWNQKMLDIEQAEVLFSGRSPQAVHLGKGDSQLEVLVGRITISASVEQRKDIQAMVDKALDLGDGWIQIRPMVDKRFVWNPNFGCSCCGMVASEVSAGAFSSNSPLGACPTCTGLGTHYEVDLERVIPDRSKTLAEGAIQLLGWQCEQEKFHKNRKILEGLATRYHFDLNTAIKDLPDEALYAVLYGTQGEKIAIENPATGGKLMHERFAGIVNLIYERFNANAKDEMSAMKAEDKEVMQEQVCPSCGGTRLKAERLLYRVGDKTIRDFSNMPLVELYAGCDELLRTAPQVFESLAAVAQPILQEIKTRLTLLLDMGLDYLNLNRPVTLLSGGESQRVRLTTQLSSGLMGMIYILDEPSVGLHPKDTGKMIAMLHRLRDLGNTILVVEHDEEIMAQADYLVDIGPGAGLLGGEIVAQGTVEEVMNNSKSLTGQYLSGKQGIPVPTQRRKARDGKYLEVIGARENNLQNLNIRIPFGCLVCVTGVSGSGKTTLVHNVIYEKLRSRLDGKSAYLKHNVELKGEASIDQVICIDQKPIGRTPRSTPATYVGVFDAIRKLFARTEIARQFQRKSAHFSFNSPGGRCEVCSGLGVIVTEMQFMSDVEMVCETCRGRRYSEDILAITYHEKNIADVLEMSIEEAAVFFADQPDIYGKLKLMNELGLGYMKLGQSATTLSGGEAQRIKLVEELSQLKKGRSLLYILDEPTTGLHPDDIQRLLTILQQLVDEGNTVLIIEHNLHLIKTADYVIDLGPEGGTRGGQLVAAGTPEQVATCEHSHTGAFLRNLGMDYDDNEVRG
ncbi:excinuclease ABC subunit UvrA [Paenibacillus sp. DRB1-1]|uniref:excinuclease ABC subunit UvrA n=1 Tax=Paenibacillus sp. DRB1-1 TaxID=3422309 RepID=UPI003F9EB9C5